MPWFLVPAGSTPPSDKPWLLSTRDELEEDEEDRKDYTKSVLKDHPFPGRNASSSDKVAWLGALHKEYEEELEASFYSTSAPEAHELAREVLLKQAPQRIVVQIHATSKDLEVIDELDEEQQARFADGLPFYGKLGYKGEKTWKSYKDWLLKNKDEIKDTIVIGQIDCGKNDELLEKCRTWARNLGLCDFFSSLEEVDKAARRACYNWGMMKVVGENTYYPLPDDQRLCYPILMGFKKPTDKDKASIKFHASLDATKQATKAGGDPKIFLLVPKAKAITKNTDEDNKEEEEEEEEEADSAEKYHVLWLPAEYDEEHDRVDQHFGWGKGETSRLQQRLQKGNTDTGNIKADMFVSEIDYIKEIKGSWRKKFCAALALTRAAVKDPYWMNDNECPETISKTVKDFAQYWRTTLLKKDDQSLGLGLGPVDAENAGPGQVSESREALMRLLEILGKKFDQMSTSYCKIKFNAKLGHSRKPKAPNAQNKRRKTTA